MSEISPENVRTHVLAGLDRLGYRGALLARNYGFADYFAPGRPERSVTAAAFGQTPISYDSACIGVIEGGNIHGVELVDEYRALGAPVILEIGQGEVREWAVSRINRQHALLGTYAAERLSELFVRRGADWRPAEFLRAKNIGFFSWEPQLSLFAGLIPELEDEIQEKMAPLLRSTMSAARQAYRLSSERDPDPRQLFKLVFWLLTAKVFRDRQVGFFEELVLSDGADAMIAAVAKHYKADPPKLLNRDARQAAADKIWGPMDFRNLSVEVLSQIWADLLVDEETRVELGIHRTPRAIVRYIVDRIPFATAGDDKRIVLEPCSGSGVFLIGAMNALRHNLFGMTPAERHTYFINHLAGIEKEPFGVEISRLALTLADFPNAGGWDIQEGDVFLEDDLRPLVRRAGIVLCNPPFRDFNAGERELYRPFSPRQPEELLHRILNDLPPEGVLGFVLPRVIVDGSGYANIRRRLADRFASIDLTILPDRAFEGADAEVGLLIAKEPIPHDVSRVFNLRIGDNKEAWDNFVHSNKVSGGHETLKTPSEASESLAIPELSEVWDFLRTHHQLSEVVSEIARGVRWNQPLVRNGMETGFRNEVVRETRAEGFRRGVPPRAKFGMFEEPDLRYLDFREKNRQYGAFKLPWDQEKVIVNKTTRSRGPWRLAAYPDVEGLACYQTFFAIWPKYEIIDVWALSAVLNSPVANAFVATREGKTDNTMETMNRIPMPYLTVDQSSKIRSLVRQYQEAMRSPIESSDAADILMRIDATVLAGYRLPPKTEHQLLEWFGGFDRPAPHAHREYFADEDSDVFFSLSDRLSPDFKAATAGELLKRISAS